MLTPLVYVCVSISVLPSCALPSPSSLSLSDGIEVARRTCGGHGYSALSGLPRLFASYVQNVTWEGDNNVLYLQVCVCVLAVWVGQAGSCKQLLSIWPLQKHARPTATINRPLLFVQGVLAHRLFWCLACVLLLRRLLLCPQTARFLLKGLLAVKAGKTRAAPLTGSMSYLNNLQQELGSSCGARGAECWANPGDRFWE